MTHKDGYRRCAVIHYDKNREPLPPCIWCANCKQWIRPENMNDVCTGIESPRGEEWETDATRKLKLANWYKTQISDESLPPTVAE